MREIKFKVWDTEYKEYSNWTNRDPHFDVSNSRLFFWERTRKEDGSYGGDIVLEDYGNRFILLQYTGLKDKNGKEIYEGDILKMSNGSTYEVKFYVEDNELDCSGYMFSSFGVEIIGNIYENPELLK